MSDADRLIEKFGVAVSGEQPAVVIVVLVAFVRQCCEQFGVDVDGFCDAVRRADLSEIIVPDDRLPD